MTATNQVEYLFASLLIASSAIVWAYTIGNFCSIVSNSDKYGIKFRQTMDELNIMLEDRHIPQEMRVRVRMYFQNSKVIERHRGYRDLENMMSLVLRGEVASAAQRQWIHKVRVDEALQRAHRNTYCVTPDRHAPSCAWCVRCGTSRTPTTVCCATSARC